MTENNASADGKIFCACGQEIHFDNGRWLDSRNFATMDYHTHGPDDALHHATRRLEELHNVNFQQARKINRIDGARADFADKLLRLLGHSPLTEAYDEANIVEEVGAKLRLLNTTMDRAERFMTRANRADQLLERMVAMLADQTQWRQDYVKYLEDGK